jgi:hypothetical protein
LAEQTEQALAWIDVNYIDDIPVISLDMSLPVAKRVVDALEVAIENSEELDSDELDLLLNLQDALRVRLLSLFALAQGMKPARQGEDGDDN